MIAARNTCTRARQKRPPVCVASRASVCLAGEGGRCGGMVIYLSSTVGHHIGDHRSRDMGQKSQITPHKTQSAVQSHVGLQRSNMTCRAGPMTYTSR